MRVGLFLARVLPLVPKLCLGTVSLETPFRLAGAKQSFANRCSQTEFGNKALIEVLTTDNYHA